MIAQSAARRRRANISPQLTQSLFGSGVKERDMRAVGTALSRHKGRAKRRTSAVSRSRILMVLGVADSMGDVSNVRGGSVVVGGGIPNLDGAEDSADGGGGDCDEETAQRDEEKVQDAKSKSEGAGRDLVKNGYDVLYNPWVRSYHVLFPSCELRCRQF